MRTPQRRTIGSHTYEVIPLGATEGSAVLARVLKVAGPVVEKLAGAEGDNTGPAAFAALATNVTPEDMLFFCNTFSRFTTVDIGVKWPKLSDIFDEHFAGNYGELLQWLSFAVETNYASFFGGGLGGLGGAAKAG